MLNNNKKAKKGNGQLREKAMVREMGSGGGGEGGWDKGDGIWGGGIGFDRIRSLSRFFG